MFAKPFARCAGAVAIGMMSCTTEPDLNQAYPTADSIPPPEISIDLPLERETPRQYPPARACLLGSTGSCLDLDSRSFEPCLVGSKVCETEGTHIVPLESRAPADPDAPDPE